MLNQPKNSESKKKSPTDNRQSVVAGKGKAEILFIDEIPVTESDDRFLFTHTPAHLGC